MGQGRTRLRRLGEQGAMMRFEFTRSRRQSTTARLVLAMIATPSLFARRPSDTFRESRLHEHSPFFVFFILCGQSHLSLHIPIIFFPHAGHCLLRGEGGPSLQL
mmetsp:Transcript_11219/g.34562  ORF Transcript_11219/g.34562 Transcript_11219/m.34562 type:complete len:104 (-) Transcript_11219:98-409(-)